MTEHFQDACGGLIGWLSSTTFYTAFGEGWALYAENPLIAKDTDVYNEEPLYKYGMLKSQVGSSRTQKYQQEQRIVVSVKWSTIKGNRKLPEVDSAHL